MATPHAALHKKPTGSRQGMIWVHPRARRKMQNLRRLQHALLRWWDRRGRSKARVSTLSATRYTGVDKAFQQLTRYSSQPSSVLRGSALALLLPHNVLPPPTPPSFQGLSPYTPQNQSKRTHHSDDTPTWSPATTPLPSRVQEGHSSLRFPSPKIGHASPKLNLSATQPTLFGRFLIVSIRVVVASLPPAA